MHTFGPSHDKQMLLSQPPADDVPPNYDGGSGRTHRLINAVAEAIGVTVLVMIVVLIFLNALGRYALSAPIVWAEELVIALIPWLTMTGVFLSVRRRAVIRIDYFIASLPKRLQSAATIFADIVSAAAFTYLAFHSFHYVTLFGGDPTTYLALPTGWFTSAMLIGSLACVVAFILEIKQQGSRS